MSTNYFNPISYMPRQPTRPAVVLPSQTSQTLPTANPNWANVTGYMPGAPNNTAAAPNQGAIQRLLAGLYGSGTPGQPGYVPGINERAATQFAQLRNNTRDALRGYGGISFRENDPSTPNVDESLMMDYQPDRLGRNERQAVLAARAAANARGMLSSGLADQQIGSALQRVGEEARQIVNQYSQQINQIATQNFDPLNGLVNTTLGQIETLYGADTRWQLEQAGIQREDEARTQAAAPAQTPPPPTPAQAAQSPAEFESVAASGAYGGRAYIGRNQPNMDTIRRRYPYPVITTSFRQPDGRYVVYVRPA